MKWAAQKFEATCIAVGCDHCLYALRFGWRLNKLDYQIIQQKSGLVLVCLC